ncbi:MAG: GNAT family N-acetyltransferase [Anaerolineae bacterium]|nr:GNAT family N-acetyltransferase [Anaerolineae bacterium]
MTEAFIFTVTDDAPLSDRDAIRQGIDDYNKQFVGHEHYQPLYILMRDDKGEIVGGLVGATYWAWLYVRFLWISDALRGQGHGSRIMQLAEEEAKRRGCTDVHLDIYDFESLSFYRKLGYGVWGRLDGIPEGYMRYFLKKNLT